MTTSDAPDGERVTISRPRKKFLLMSAILVAFILAAFVGIGIWPVPVDDPGDEATVGVPGGSNGLKQLFPAMVGPSDNLVTHPQNAERLTLGQLLFFDPILSGANDISCATCHHPDLGFSDGRSLSMGTSGRGTGPDRREGLALRRSAPSLWNVNYYQRLLWDGRAKDLEEQALLPIIDEREMNEIPERLLSELRRIPEYVERFDRAFGRSGGENLSMENIAKALAAFERTLTANHSPFDRFVAGDRTALTESQRRGFNVFRSGKTRCIECHDLPTFADRNFKVVGLLDSNDRSDLGRFEITQRPMDRFAFKIPTLRNIALSAPYMHNGSLKNLDEVIDFYSSGGKPWIGVPVDDKLRAFLLTKQERQDLIAFLHSLTDESNLPEIPNHAPSGLPVISHLDNPARKLAADYNKGSLRKEVPPRPPTVLRVEAGQSIQATIDKAIRGDVIEVAQGVYHEELTVDVDNLTLRAVTSVPSGNNATGQPAPSGRPVLDGKDEMSDGLIVSGSDFRFEGFEIKNYVANAALIHHARNLALTNIKIEKSGMNGVHIFRSNEVTIEKVIVHDAIDIGIYVDSSRRIRIINCESYENTVGIHVENCLDTVVDSNSAHDNTCGVIIANLPNSASTVAKDCRVTNNRILNNNATNATEIGTLVGELARGVGILILGADNTEVASNEIRGNASYAVGVLGHYSFIDSGVKFDLEAVPENNWIHNNVYSGNGGAPATAVLDAGLGGGDLVWDLSGWSNRWTEANASRPAPVLNGAWPAIVRRVRWRMLNWFFPPRTRFAQSATLDNSIRGATRPADRPSSRGEPAHNKLRAPPPPTIRL